MEDTSQLIAKLELAMSKLQLAVDQFPSSKREKMVFGEWSLRDILAHFSGWNLLTLKELEMLQSGTKVDKWTGGQETDEFNNQSVEHRKSWKWDEVYDEFTETQTSLLQKYKELTPENWQAQFGPGETDTPLESIKVDIQHIAVDHLPQIEQKLI